MDDTLLSNALSRIEAKVDTVLESNIKIKAVLFDMDGNKGICTKLDEVCQDIRRHRNHIFRLWIAVTIIASSIGGGVFGVIRFLSS